MFLENEQGQKLVRYLGWLAIALIVFVAISAINAIKENKYIGGMPTNNVITVEGKGEVTAVPDIAQFTFSVLAEAKTVDEAQDAAAKKSNAIIDFLDKEGIDEKDIKTLSYNVNPRYEYQAQATASFAPGQPVAEFYPQPSKRVLIGYEVRQSVSVKVRDTEEVGKLITGVGELGATDMYGPTFTIDDEEELMRDARKEAIENAKEKAEQLADDLDVKLVRVVSFYENSYPRYYGGYGGAEFAMDEVAVAKNTTVPEIPAGENTVTVNISVTYEIR